MPDTSAATAAAISIIVAMRAVRFRFGISAVPARISRTVGFCSGTRGARPAFAGLFAAV